MDFLITVRSVLLTNFVFLMKSKIATKLCSQKLSYRTESHQSKAHIAFYRTLSYVLYCVCLCLIYVCGAHPESGAYILQVTEQLDTKLN